MTRYRLTIAYDGTRYSGWQVQPNGVSIQALVQKSLEVVLRSQVDLTGAGRTDAGVHAQGQTAHFDASVPFKPSQLVISLNALLPSDIRIVDLVEVASDFHARYSALGKIYTYDLHTHPVQNPFFRLYRWHILQPLDLARMEKGAEFLLGEHDFSSFANEAKRGSAAKDPVRTLKSVAFSFLPGLLGGLRLILEADGFLYKMVRNIVGTLVEVGLSRIPAEEVKSILDAKDRRHAKMAAPACGLTLKKVLYELP